MNTNKTLIISIAGGSFVMVILGLIIYNVSGNTGDGKVSNTTQKKGYTLPSDYDKDFDPDDLVHIAKEEKKIYNNYNNDEMDEKDDMPIVGGKTRRIKKIRKIKKTINKKRKHKKTIHNKSKI